MLIVLSVAGVAVAAFLAWYLFRHFATSRIDGLVTQRRATSRIVSPAEFVDGNRHLQVALALTSSHLFYENADMNASLDLEWVRAVEYDTSLVTGAAIPGSHVLRIRCFSQSFEFVVRAEDAQRWQTMLPPRPWTESAAGTRSAAPASVATT